METGKVSLSFENSAKKDLILSDLDSFGESAFRKNGRREGRAVVEEDLVCLTINEEKMTEILGGTLTNIVFHNIKKWALGCCPIFHEMESIELDRIAAQFETKLAQAGDVIFKKNKPVDRLIINLEGRMNNHPVGMLMNDEYFPAEGECLDH